MAVIAAPGRLHGRNRLLWGLRHHAWLPAVTLLLGLTIALVPVARATPTYSAKALVVASQLEISPTLLPRFSSVIFESGAVAASVISKEGLRETPSELVPGEVTMEPLQDSVLFQVTAKGRDPRAVARLANDAAAAFVIELNRPGKGIGTFALQQAAAVPQVAERNQVSTALRVVVGLLAGLLAGLALVALVVALTAPVLSGADLDAEHIGPLLGLLALPPRRQPHDAREVGGVETVSERLMGLSAAGDVVLHAAGRADLRRVVNVLSEVLPRTGAVQRSDASGTRAASKTADDPGHEVVRRLRPARVLAVGEGTSARRLRQALEGMPAEPDGVILVRRLPAGLTPLLRRVLPDRGDRTETAAALPRFEARGRAHPVVNLGAETGAR